MIGLKELKRSVSLLMAYVAELELKMGRLYQARTWPQAENINPNLVRAQNCFEAINRH